MRAFDSRRSSGANKRASFLEAPMGGDRRRLSTMEKQLSYFDFDKAMLKKQQSVVLRQGDESPEETTSIPKNTSKTDLPSVAAMKAPLESMPERPVTRASISSAVTNAYDEDGFDADEEEETPASPVKAAEVVVPSPIKEPIAEKRKSAYDGDGFDAVERHELFVGVLPPVSTESVAEAVHVPEVVAVPEEKPVSSYEDDGYEDDEFDAHDESSARMPSRKHSLRAVAKERDEGPLINVVKKPELDDDFDMDKAGVAAEAVAGGTGHLGKKQRSMDPEYDMYAGDVFADEDED